MDNITIVGAILAAALTGLTGLVSLVWKMHGRRIDALKEEVEANHRTVQEQLREDRVAARETRTTIFAKLDGMATDVAKIPTAIEALRGDFAEKYMQKADCKHDHRRGD